MMNAAILSASLMVLAKMLVRAYEIHSMPLDRRLNFTHMVPVKNLALQLHPPVLQKKCFVNGILAECPVYPMDYISNIGTSINKSFERVVKEQRHQNNSNSNFENSDASNSKLHEVHPPRSLLDQNPVSIQKMLPSLRKSGEFALHQNTGYPTSIGVASMSNNLNMKLDSSSTKHNKSLSMISESSMNKLFPRWMPSHEDSQGFELTISSTNSLNSGAGSSLRDIHILEQFTQSLDNFERKFYVTTFSKLTSQAPPSRRENGMSYVQSGLFLHLALMALSTEVSSEARREIDECLEFYTSDQERIQLINATISSLPASDEDLKFLWSSRLVLQSQNISSQFRINAARVLHLQIDRLNGTATPKEMANTLNHMVEVDSGGAIHDTFEEDDLSEGVRAILISTLYLRARWRSAPTLLNGTWPFHDSQNAPNKTIRMIRVNDIMRYADLTEWDAEAIEIFYSTPGLSLLMLVPRGNSIRRLAQQVQNANHRDLTERMKTLRIAASLPLYTLRMTLFLPNKLEAMNISQLVDINNSRQNDSFRLSHAVQRIMFWAEAGRNAFKDDGYEWDETPQRELVVDRPYIFFVRWKNKTLMNGNFVL